MKFFTKKKIIWTVVIVLLLGGIGYRVVKGKNPAAGITTEVSKKQDITQTVLATGQVVSGTDLNLSFQISGTVQQVSVHEGDKVTAGQQLAALDAQSQQASLTSARGALAQAQANYDRVLAGASSDEVNVAQKAVDAAQVALTNAQTSLSNTQQQQNTVVANAYSALLNSGFTAVPSPNNLSTATVTVSGTYTGSDQGTYKITLYNTGLGQRFQVSGIENADGEVKSTPVPLGTKGLFIQFNGTTGYLNDSWTVAIPNTQALTYVANNNAYQAALKNQSAAVDAATAQVASAKVALDQARAALQLKQAQARPADIEAAKAQILSAQGQVQAASANLENTIIRAPADGTITKVDSKPGELASPQKEVLVLQDVENLHVEANVSEANIVGIKPGQSVDITFDSLGSDRHFAGTVESINPAATIVSGVVNYKVTASIRTIPEIKPDMTANMTILINQKSGVITVPSRAITSHDGKKFVRVVDDSKKKTYHEAEVQTGLDADGGVTEITGGLSAGTEIVTFIKQ